MYASSDVLLLFAHLQLNALDLLQLIEIPKYSAMEVQHYGPYMFDKILLKCTFGQIKTCSLF